MRNIASGRLATLLVSLCFACGGKSPPAQTGGAAQPAPAAPLPDTSAPSGPEPTHAPELAAGLKAFDAGNYGEARTDFDAAGKKNPQDYEALWNLGQACEKLGDNKGAEAAYKSELGVREDDDRAAAELANLYVVDGNVDDALKLAKSTLAKKPGSAPLHAAMGQALAARDDQDLATQEFEQAVKLAPADPMLHYTFATWLNRWHVRGAAAHLDAALPLVQNDWAMIVSIGHEYRMAGEFDSCVRTLDKAIRTKDAGEPRTERALCKLGLKDDAGALADLQAAVGAEPGYAPGHYYLGGRLAMSKHFKEAAAEYQKYLDLAPNGSLAKQAADRFKLAQDAAAHDKGAARPRKKK